MEKSRFLDYEKMSWIKSADGRTHHDYYRAPAPRCRALKIKTWTILPHITVIDVFCSISLENICISFTVYTIIHKYDT